MPRTTIDLDATVLHELKARQRREGKPLGQIASELLARALADDQPPTAPAPFAWTSQAMGARVDLQDKEALADLLEQR